MLFGDGAAASWIAEPAEFGGTPLISAFEDFRCASDGKGWDKFIVPGGGQRHPVSHDSAGGSETERRDKIEMNGLHVLNLVGDRVVSQIRSLLADHALTADQIDQFLFHQASNLALDSLGKRLGIPPERRYSNLARVGNTVSSSLPILVKDCMSEQAPATGSRLFLCGFGVGYSWASLLARR
jgi:3-oxoacyl-[acyl-carrier-protein] synthase-3